MLKVLKVLKKIKEVSEELEQVIHEVEVLIHSSFTSDDVNKQQLNLEAKYDALIQKIKKLEHQKKK